MNLPLPPRYIPFFCFLRLVTCVDGGRVCGLACSWLKELVHEGVNVRQERRGSGGLGPLPDGRGVRDFGARRDRSVQIQVRGSDVVPVDNDQEDHEGRAEDHKDAEHPGSSHGDCCSLQGHHGNRVRVRELFFSMAIDRRQL